MDTTHRRDAGISRRDVLAGMAGTLAAQACQSASGRPPASARTRERGFDLEQFVADCVAASNTGEPQAAVREVLARGVSDPAAMLAAVGEPRSAGLTVFHRSPTLTIFAAVWTPQMTLMPHDHRMWALIGIYTGREDNIFWERTTGGLESSRAECLFEGDVATLSETAIHSVTNPLERFTGGLHVYGGDFFATKRSQWDPETLAEQPSDGEVIRRVFERANQRYERMQGT